MARRVRVSPSTVAKAPTGAEHPPPRARTKARSAKRQSWLSLLWKPWRNQGSKPWRPCTARIPWPAAGSISSGEKVRLIRRSSPRRFKPAAASTRAENSPRSSFSRRVRTFPRTRATGCPGNSSPSWARRRGEEQPMGRPGSSREAPLGSTSTSRGSSRGEKATRGSRGSSSMGRSLLLCTVRSASPESNAWSSSLTNSPLPPIFSKGRSRILSPVVFLVSSSTWISGSQARMASMTIWVWIRASLLSRLPTTTFTSIPPKAAGWPGPRRRFSCGPWSR